MEIPLQITGRNIKLTEAIETEIRQKAEKLDKFYDRIMRCRVVVESPHRHQHQGKLYNLNIYMTVPGSELIVKREPHEDLYVAIRDGFNAARRKLEDFARRQRGDVKHHEEALHARISVLFPEKGYGFITTPENREIYFHEHSILNCNFKKLKVGMEVRFVEEKGEKGPQASTVKVI
jgi:ribosomal subunit interface protein